MCLYGGGTWFVGIAASLFWSCHAAVARVGILRSVGPMLGFVGMCVVVCVGIAFGNNVNTSRNRFVVDMIVVSLLGSIQL